jgi:hypothetical protein
VRENEPLGDSLGVGSRESDCDGDCVRDAVTAKLGETETLRDLDGDRMSLTDLDSVCSLVRE